ncbi:TorF family putative porin [Derxia lacustris]|uniref:TorF family putative porin n=1 Tax=Derxia lacustris TaxID=764842 RepID=UPI000A16E964|nr:TorF family putative porin [Derxia lacustris]
MNSKKQLAALAFVAAGGCLAAHAEEAPAEAPVAEAPALTTNVTLASQYVSRGFRQTWGKPALQGGIDYALGNGFSIGSWMSSVSNRFIEDGSVEWDLYGGWTGALDDITYGAQLYYYVYPGAKLKFADASYNYGEFVPQASWKWFSAKYWLTYTKDYFGYNSRSLLADGDKHSRWSGYLDLNATVDLGEGFGATAHFGQQRVSNFKDAGWKDGKIAVTKALDGGWLLSAAVTRGWGNKSGYYDKYTTGATNSAGFVETSNPIKSTFFVSATRTF